MKKMIKCLSAVVLLALVTGLTGCAMTVEQMYRIPRRSERYQILQTEIDRAMTGLSYSAPTAGENQQTVQMADLDGDGNSEVIVFAKGTDEDPMKILLFAPVEDGYELKAQISGAGSGFDQVEYVQMDGLPGLELVVGCQVSDQVLRKVSVYSFSDGQTKTLLTANYRKFLICDMDSDSRSDLFVLYPGTAEAERGLAAVYSVKRGVAERSTECELSGPVENLKRIVTGSLESGQPAVFVASTAGEESIITDVYAMVAGTLKNVSFSNESGTSTKTLRNYYVYADDIDMDGVVELPDLITMQMPAQRMGITSQHLIRWYSMTADGSEVDKLYTYHNYLEGWYLELDQEMATRICVVTDPSGGYQFQLWNEDMTASQTIFTLYTLTGEDRLAVAEEGDLHTVMKTDTVVYAARIEDAGSIRGLTVEYLSECFRLIQQDWKTGEM